LWLLAIFFGDIIIAVTQKLSVSNVLIGKAFTTLLATQLTASTSIGYFMLEGNVLLVILTMYQLLSFFFLAFCSLYFG
jgi:hypothetical protein